jgi:hypothetical protein
MPLTITTDLTVITTAETITGWTTYGAGGAGAAALEPDFFAQGSNCISRGVSGATIKGMSFDIGAGNVLNFTTTHAGKLIYIWMRTSTPGLCETRENGGIRIVLGSGATAPADAAGVWSAWYVDGSNTIAASDGWKCYVIDPTLPPSTTFGGGVDITAIRWFGGVQRSTGTLKGQNFGIDQISYGFGELRCRGTNNTAGLGFKEMSDDDFGTITNRYGIMIEKEGVFLVQGKLVIGDSISVNSTDFTSQNETVVWERKTYYDGTRESPCIKDVNPNTGLSYFGIDFRGNGTGNTNVTLGVKVGTGDTATGRSGTLFIGSRIKTSFDFDDGSVENVKIYGCTFRRIRGGIDMSGNTTTDEFIGNTLVECGSFQAGSVITRANSFIDNLGGAYSLYEDFKNDAAGAEALATADPQRQWINLLNGSNFSVPSKVEYVELLDPGASDRREVVLLNAIYSGAQTISVVAASSTYTRSAGSFLTDGFRAGQTVTFSGFTNAGNNTTKVIQSVTATVITVTNNSGLVNETGNGDEQVVDSDGVGSNDHYAEAIINWPTAGANQGALGVIIRSSPTAENYWYLKCDIIAQTISLIRCDTGTDTVVDGPDSFAFAEGTDYLVHLIGRGTLIEGFVNGQKVATTSSTHQSNRMVGIRGDAEADQTGDAPRLSRFGAGPITNFLGALVMSSATDDVKYCSFINNARATDLLTTGTYSYSNHNFSGNLVDIRNDSSGAATIDVVGTGGSPAIKEEVDDAATTINNAVTITVTVLNTAGVAIQNARVAIYRASDNSELLNALTNPSGIATTTFAFVSNTNIYIRVRKTSTGSTRYFNNDSSGTITSSGFSSTITMITDSIASV